MATIVALAFTFACTRHRILLAETCPSCGEIPRSRAHYTGTTSALGICPTKGCAPGTLPARPPRDTHPRLAGASLQSITPNQVHDLLLAGISSASTVANALDASAAHVCCIIDR